jgi:hypothetical protein
MKRRIMANQVAARLFETEAAIDGALGKVASLAGLLPAARMESNISAVVGQGAFESIARSLTALTQARREIVDTHHRLVEMQNAVGLARVAFGGPEKPPEGEVPKLPGFEVFEGRKAS